MRVLRGLALVALLAGCGSSGHKAAGTTTTSTTRDPVGDVEMNVCGGDRTVDQPPIVKVKVTNPGTAADYTVTVNVMAVEGDKDPVGAEKIAGRYKATQQVGAGQTQIVTLEPVGAAPTGYTGTCQLDSVTRS